MTRNGKALALQNAPRRPSPISPAAGFDWAKVLWSGPRQARPDNCAYCAGDIPDEAVPLMMWREDGAMAQFCDACAAKWFGFGTFVCEET